MERRHFSSTGRMLNPEYEAEIGLFFKNRNQLQYHRFTGNFIHVYIIYA